MYSAIDDVLRIVAIDTHIMVLDGQTQKLQAKNDSSITRRSP